ncbi:Rieske 2Fe-2S domain-containing protein [Paraburkholderia sp. A2WS-5]|uniref:Rieske (2Fe-2S) protein n=1 Tax=unclassified Paraburkholderia TaxID=2615204 RepID=UPI003B78755D
MSSLKRAAVCLLTVAELSEWEERTSRGFDPEGAGQDSIFVVRLQGLRAYLNSCPHWPGTPLAWRKDHYLDTDRQFIVCSAHGAHFEINTGVCVAGPCIGQRLTQVSLIQTAKGEICLADTDI